MIIFAHGGDFCLGIYTFISSSK